MGPSTLVDGDESYGVLLAQPSRSLQWGRRLSSTETPPDRVGRLDGVVASMGPSTLVDGDANILASVTSTASGFNGAVDSRRRRPAWERELGAAGKRLQWGRRLSSTETFLSIRSGRLSHSCFNGAVDSRRRRRSPTCSGPPPSARFNGAVDSRRRRLSGDHGRGGCRARA